MAPRRKKTSRKKEAAPRQASYPGMRLMLWAFASGLTVAGLVLILLLPHKDSGPSKHAGLEEASELSAEITRHKTQTASIAQEKHKPFVYEETMGADFDLRVWKADMAIMQTLSLMGYAEDRMVHKTIEPRFFYGTPYHFQELTIYTSITPDQFIKGLNNSLERFLSNATLKHNLQDSKVSIYINGQNTHLITLEKILEPPLPGSGRLVIIIDDLGGNLEYAKELGRLDFPVVFSILPHMHRTREVVDYARKNNIEKMLHLPMEPLGYPRGIEPGPGALFVNMDQNEIRTRVRDNLAQVPGAIGVNNHMGSRFTQDLQGMEVVFEELAKHGLFFVDSLTTSRSVAERLAREMDIDFLKRSVFLDNVQDKHAILFQLGKAENIAIKHGLAIAIGHPYPETMEALTEWNSLRNNRVEVVQVSEFISTQRYRTALQDKPEAILY